ncbi:MAG TPA: hypothetical protein VNJ03_14700 [Vicinamibacterales bacterium]|nr:hypothetical protein [Vicinamibacterales bacterium]
MHTILAVDATPTNLSHNGARRMRRWLMLLVLPVVAACNGTTPTVPTPVVLTTPAAPGPAQNPPASVEGIWVGTMIPKSTFSGYPATLTVVQTGTTLSGRWFGPGSEGPDTGVMTGTYATDGSITMTWDPSEEYTCPLGVKGTVSGGVMTAQYGTIQCSRDVAIGGLSLRRQ